MRNKCARPSASDQQTIHDIIIKELVIGEISSQSRDFILNLTQKHRVADGIDSVFLACTELPCFFTETDFGIPIQDSISVTIDNILVHSG